MSKEITWVEAGIAVSLDPCIVECEWLHPSLGVGVCVCMVYYLSRCGFSMDNKLV